MRYLLFIFFLLCYQRTIAQSNTTGTPKTIENDWPVADLNSQGFDDTLFRRFLEEIDTQKHKLHSMLVIRHGQLVFESYFNGQSASDEHDIRSVSKSIISLLTGIALENGRMPQLNETLDPKLNFFSNAKNYDPRKDEISYQHLLTMSTGLDCNDGDPKSKGQEDKLYRKKHWRDDFASLPMINNPGDTSLYCTGGVMLLAHVLEIYNGMAMPLLAEETLFKPLGISQFSSGHTKSKPMPTETHRFYMRPRDMAKIGQLVLNKGLWEGKQVVPESWIEEIAQPKVKLGGRDYSYLWWQYHFQKDGKTYTAIAASGNGGQYILAFPELDMVAVFTGGAYNSPEARLPLVIVNRIILPSLRL